MALSAHIPDAPGDFLADLTTAPIFDDRVYLLEALNVVENQNEDDLDAHLAMSARESGIEDPYRFLCPDTRDISIAFSTMTASTEQRSSMSIHSGETQSTGVTSHPSRTSKDSPYLEASTVLRARPLTRASMSSDNYYDSMLDRFRPSMRHSHSSSTVSGAASVLSSASSLPKPTPPKQKRSSTLGIFSMFRKDSSACSSRCHHGHHTKPLSPKLECGHTLSKYAIRVHIQEALESKDPVPPSCCGKPLPRSILETVLTKEETDIVLPSVSQSPIANSLRDSGYSEDCMSSIDLSHTLGTGSHTSGVTVTAPCTPSRDMAREDEERLNRALANEAFKSLKSQQKEQFRRVSLFEANQRKALSAYHAWSLRRLASQLETNTAKKTKQHGLDLERLDESQIVAEHDLRKSQAQETQNVATALKYMEAYCAGSNPANPEVVHSVTEEDRRKLARQHLTEQKLPAKHESAINVLRARQEKDTKTKLQKQQAEFQQIRADFERDNQREQVRFMRDLSRLEALNEARRRRLKNRWDLRFEVWRCDWENQHGITLPGQLPHEAWPEMPVDAPLDPSSSLALYLQVTD